MSWIDPELASYHLGTLDAYERGLQWLREA